MGKAASESGSGDMRRWGKSEWRVSQPKEADDVHKPQYILALDQGTTSSRAILFNAQGVTVAAGHREIRQIYPQPGWVEHDPEEIWQAQWSAAQDCLARAGVGVEHLAAIGIANQRETTVVWDRRTGHAICNAIVWQCRRTAGVCQMLHDRGLAPLFQEKTGLVLDAYFSGTKVGWILDHISGARALADAGHLQFGTVDSWLVYKLTGNKVWVTDVSNASRTLLFNIHTMSWDGELLEILGVPRSMCPEVVDSSGIVGETAPRWLGRAIPIAGLAGDQSAALFGQGCWEKGMVKNTYGTGSFLLMNTGDAPVSSLQGLITTIAWRVNGQLRYALEGSIFITGAVVQWLRDELQMIQEASDSEALAFSVPDTRGVYVVPAFVGLGAPYWDSYARGTIVGLTRGVNRAHIVRAALESIAYQTRDVVEAMVKDCGRETKILKGDGGAIANRFLAQFQADILGIPVERPQVAETTAMGAAFLAGLGVGMWTGLEPLSAILKREALFVPVMSELQRNSLYAGWRRAVERSRGWEAHV